MTVEPLRHMPGPAGPDGGPGGILPEVSRSETLSRQRCAGGGKGTGAERAGTRGVRRRDEPASCAAPAIPPAPCSTASPGTSGPRPWCRRPGSCSTAGTTAWPERLPILDSAAGGVGLPEPLQLHTRVPAGDQGDKEHQRHQAHNREGEGVTRMKLHEYQAKTFLRDAGIPVPEGRVAATPAEAEKIAEEIGFPVMVKAQVLVGGRGKAGGVKMAKSRQEAAAGRGTSWGCPSRASRSRKCWWPGRWTSHRSSTSASPSTGRRGACSALPAPPVAWR